MKTSKMLKKALSLCLAAVLLFGGVAIPGSLPDFSGLGSLFAKAIVEDGFTYTVTSEANKEASLTEVPQDTAGKVIIPAQVELNGETYTVTEIGTSAFYRCEKVTSVVIDKTPEPWKGVTKIGKLAFASCTGLESIDIGVTVRAIEERAFADCTSLKKVYLNNVETLGNRAFENCTAITELDTGDKLSVVPANAFFGCTAIKNIRFGHAMTKVETAAFKGCVELAEVNAKDSKITGIEASTFEGCTALTTYITSNNLKDIGDRAFYGCKSLSVFGQPDNEIYSLPSTVETIGASAFEGCVSFTSITVPAGVQTISDGAFSGCTGLKTLDLKDGIKTISANAFYGCTSLDHLKLPLSIINVGDFAFQGCTSLANLELNNGLKTIGESAFESCTALKKKVVAPQTLISLGAHAFRFCSSLVGFDMNKANLETRMGEGVFYNCTSLEEVIMDTATITRLPAETFKLCTSLKKMNPPKTTVQIGNSVCEGCVNLDSISIPDSVKKVGDNAFRGCIKLWQVEFANPKTLTGDPADKIQVKEENTVVFGEYLFKGCSALERIELPKCLRVISKGAFENCTSLSYVGIPGATEFELVNVGNGVVDELSTDSKITLDGVVKIDTWAFNGCEKLVDVIIPASVTHIDRRAFNTTVLSIDYAGTESQWSGSSAIIYIDKTDGDYFENADVHFYSKDCEHDWVRSTYANGDFVYGEEHPHKQYERCTKCSEVVLRAHTSGFVADCQECSSCEDCNLIWSGYTAEHPHCAVYRCTVCKREVLDKNYTKYDASCNQCTGGSGSGSGSGGSGSGSTPPDVPPAQPDVVHNYDFTKFGGYTTDHPHAPIYFCKTCRYDHAMVFGDVGYTTACRWDCESCNGSDPHKDSINLISVKAVQNVTTKKVFHILTTEMFNGAGKNTLSMAGIETSQTKDYLINTYEGQELISVGAVEYSIPIPDGFDSSRVAVYYVNANTNEATNMNATIVGGRLVFTTNLTGFFSVAEIYTPTVWERIVDFFRNFFSNIIDLLLNFIG